MKQLTYKEAAERWGPLTKEKMELSDLWIRTLLSISQGNIVSEEKQNALVEEMERINKEIDELEKIIFSSPKPNL
jgi:hypothetical protein